MYSGQSKIIDNFAKAQENFKYIDVSDNAKRRKVAVVVREKFQALMQDEIDFDKMKYLIPKMQNV